MNCQSADSWLVVSKFYILNSQSFSYTQCTLLKSAVFIFYLVTLFGCLPVLIRSYLFTILGTGMPNQSIWFVISLHDGNLMFLNSSLAWLTFQKHFHHINYKTSFRKWNDWFHKINPMPYSLLPTKPWKKIWRRKICRSMPVCGKHHAMKIWSNNNLKVNAKLSSLELRRSTVRTLLVEEI